MIPEHNHKSIIHQVTIAIAIQFLYIIFISFGGKYQIYNKLKKYLNHLLTLKLLCLYSSITLTSELLFYIQVMLKLKNQ